MNESEIIFNRLIERFPDFEKLPLLIALLEESCEHVAKSDISDKDKEGAALIALYTSLPLLVGTLKAGLENADSITLNYRGRVFHLTTESPFLKAFFELPDL